jgi:hypothetical protein
MRAVPVEKKALAENRELPVDYEKEQDDEHMSSGVGAPRAAPER